ncbi:MAG: hypothetical protein SPJ06_04015 [Bacilli bacterium]|nr:hypothetical protein [Bacilli bacterium]
MGYRLWHGTFEDVLDCYHNGTSCFGQLDIFGREKTTNVTLLYVDNRAEFALEDIDFITAGFKDEADFASSFGMLGESGSITREHILMTHVYDGLKEDRIVYNSPLLKKCALEVKSKKRKGYLDNEIWLARSSELLDFVKRITGYIRDKKLGSELSSLSLSPRLIQGISRYTKSCERKKDKDDKKSFEAIYSGCLKYSNLRKLIIWEQEYLSLEREKRSLSGLKGSKTKELKADAFKSISDEEKMRRAPLVTDVISNIYDTRDSEGNIDWDRVWNEHSADDVYRPGNFDDLQRIGFFGTGETAESVGFSSDTTNNSLVKNK